MYLKIVVLFLLCFSCLKDLNSQPEGKAGSKKKTAQKTSRPGSREIYVSLQGNDSNNGSRQQPLASVEQARIMVRSIKGPVTVYIRGGVYYLQKPVVFTSADSRTPDAPVVYRPYSQEQVIVSGAVPLKLHWLQTGTVAHAPVSGKVLVDQLFVNGKAQRQARYPNYDSNARNFGGVSADALSPERIASWKDPAGGYIHSLHASEWGDFSFQITGKDAQGKLTMVGGYQNNRPSPMNPRIRFVENIEEELDQPGEFFFNPNKHELRFITPENLNINTALVEVPQLESLFEFRGTEGLPVSGINLSGLFLTHTLRTFMKNKEPLLRSDWTIYRGGAVTMEGAVNCKIRNCTFKYLGGNAIVVSDYNRRDTIEGCDISDIGSSAVVFVGDPEAVRSPLFQYEQSNRVADIDRTPGPKNNNYPAYCVVYNNLIERIGLVEKQVAGVQLSMCADITISHNTIDDVPRSGININEGTWGGHIIENNDVFNTVKETGDHGAFNSWGRDRYWQPDRRKMDSIVAAFPDLILLDVVKPIKIRNNRFRCDHGWDIDLDDGSSNYEIYNNVLLNGGLKLREGFRRKVYNNVILNNSFHPHVWFKNSGDRFERNTIQAPYFPIGIKDWGRDIDHNFFLDTVALASAKAHHTDSNSLSGSPMFISPATGDYRVEKTSKALQTGFENFPMDQFGVVSENLRRKAQKVPLPVLVHTKQSSTTTYDFFGSSIKNLTSLGELSAVGMGEAKGVLVLSVPPSSVLNGQLLANDVILRINEQNITEAADLLKIKMSLQLVKQISVTIFRNQKEQKLIVNLTGK